MALNILISLVFCAVCTLLYCYVENNSQTRDVISQKLFAALVAAAAVIRFYFALQDYWFPTDVGNFSAWGVFATKYGFGQMYKQGHFIDYPPGYMYPLYLLTVINNLLGFEYGSVHYAFVMKLPAMIADFALAYLIYTVCKKHQNESFAKFAALVFLFMPVVITNSSMWGQIESFFILFIAISILCAFNSRTIPAAISFAYALAIKPQAILFGPVLLFYIIKSKSFKEFFKAVGAGLGSFYLMVLPFCENLLDIGWLIKLYPSSMGTYQYVTVNGYNLYYLLGFNWADNSVMPYGGAINFAVIAFSVAVTGFAILSRKDNSAFFSTAALTVAMMFCFCTMMHERYIYPAIVFTLLGWAVTGKRAMLVFSVVIATLNQFNTSWVLALYEGAYRPNDNVCRLVALLTVITVVCYAVYIIRGIFKDRKIAADSIKTDKSSYIKITEMNLKGRKSAKTVVTVITLVYAVVALAGLGSIKAPQSFYQSASDREIFTIKFDQPADISKIYVYSGLGDEATEPYGRKVCGEFEILSSADGYNFSYLCDITGQSVYTWKEYSVSAPQTAALQILAKNAGAVLHEIAVFDSDGNVVKGSVSLEYGHEENPYNALYAFDEQHTIPKDTSCYSSMYFDEIYHGRTAYEQLHGLQIYETTHPPLGKIIISIGIALFGMTPFGWRIMGALCGVAMVPVMYLLAEKLGGKKAGTAAALLVALDFMHLTQTRIATVDTYVVLFCLLTFMFMAYYHKTEFGNVKKEWLYLALSGLFMGCAVASKWNGAYPMVALAVLFFISIFAKYKNSGRTKAEKIYIAKTLMMCCLFFVAVPLVIYTLSYIPVIKAHTVNDYIRQLINYQKHMYDYHANLEAEHFFSSMWYSWPLCIKPVWYAVANTANGWASSISAFGNPLIWVMTVPAVIYCLFKGVKDRKPEYLFASFGWLSSYIPWVFVTRLCFIYHYFPCAMFGIVAMSLLIRDVVNKYPKAKKYVGVYFAVCLVLFVVFLPVTTGWPAPKGYIEFLEFLPDWYFINL